MRYHSAQLSKNVSVANNPSLKLEQGYIALRESPDCFRRVALRVINAP